MGFSYSPLWCNLYFVAYEIQFMMWLAKLGHFYLMPAFAHAYQYIDDLCMLNHPDILNFLQPNTPCDQSNPFWIYPLPLVEIQTELDVTRDLLPGWAGACWALSQCQDCSY